MPGSRGDREDESFLSPGALGDEATLGGEVGVLEGPQFEHLAGDGVAVERLVPERHDLSGVFFPELADHGLCHGAVIVGQSHA